VSELLDRKSGTPLGDALRTTVGKVPADTLAGWTAVLADMAGEADAPDRSLLADMTPEARKRLFVQALSAMLGARARERPQLLYSTTCTGPMRPASRSSTSCSHWPPSSRSPCSRSIAPAGPIPGRHAAHTSRSTSIGFARPMRASSSARWRAAGRWTRIGRRGSCIGPVATRSSWRSWFGRAPRPSAAAGYRKPSTSCSRRASTRCHRRRVPRSRWLP
jgi:hypothetical protein